MAGQGSARVTLKEIDLSQVRDQEQLPQGVPAAVVGPAKRGPAFVPKTFATIQQFSETFGSMLEQSRLSNSNLYAPLALNEWMKNAQAGTYMRVLGVGDGQKAINNKVTNAGFKVGSPVSHDGSNDLKNNAEIYSTGANQLGLNKAGRTYMLGAMMADMPASRYLTDAGVQPEATAASLIGAIDVAGTAAVGNSITIFLPKEVTPAAVTTDVTLTLELVNAKSVGAVAKNKIEIVHAGDVVMATAIKNALNYNNTAADEGEFKFSDLSGINPSQVFTVTDVGGSNVRKTITLDSTRKEGDEVVLTQTSGGQTLLGGTTTLVGGLHTKTLTGASTPAPVIRGVLMTPQGVVASINVASNQANYSDYESGTNSAKAVADGDNLRNFGSNAASNLLGNEVGLVSNNSFTLVLNGFKSTVESQILTCSFDPDSVNYFAKVLNTDSTKIEEKGHFLYANWDVYPAVASIADGNTAFCLPGSDSINVQDFESFESRFRTSESPWITSQLFGKGSTTQRGTTLSASGSYKLFKLYSIDDGESGNTRFRVLVSNVRSSGSSKFGSFDLSLEAFDSDPVKGEVLISWKNLNLDPDSRNYIARVIGDKHTFFNFDKTLSKQRLEETGDFEVKNRYVRVEVSDLVKQGDVPVNSLPVSFGGLKSLNTVYSGSGDKIFAEKGTNGSGQNALIGSNKFDNLMVLPANFVKSVSRKSGSSLVADSVLPWGMKFGRKTSSDESYKETSHIYRNDSVSSWTKYFPDLGQVKAILEGDEADAFQSSYFSLEKIAVKLLSSGAIDWSSATYCRNGILPVNYARFLQTSSDATGQNVKFMQFRTVMQGGFDGVNIFDKEKAELTSVAAFREANDETSTVTGTATFTGPTVESYKRAIDVLSDKSATEFQLLAIPGIREPLITDYAIDACESRFDAMLVMDIEDVDKSSNVILDESSKSNVRNTISRFEGRSLDTSFAAAYYPDVFVRKPSNNSPLRVPPSVGMLGVMSLNDTIADPWFAPAGLSRGRLNAVRSQVQMNRDLLDELYDADINPIYEPAGRKGEVYAFGQKTLLQNQSALDRINVRRLLINIRRRVKNIAQTLLFEPNRESTLAKFSALVEPIMAEVQARQGVDRYKVQIDTTTTTQNDVENNTIRGKIYLQPTKSIEFISLDFVVTNSID